MTATQSNDERTLTRRGVLKTTAAGVGSVATVSGASKLGASPVGLVAANPIAIGAGAAALGYLMEVGADLFIGSQKDYSSYTGFDALKTNVYAGALEAKSIDERVMTSIENNLQNSVNVALAKGKAALVEALNAGKSQSEADSAMTAAVNDYYATIQKNIFTHVTAQLDKLGSMASALTSHPDAPNNISMYRFWKTTNGASYASLYSFVDEDGTQTVSFINGDSQDYVYNTISEGAVSYQMDWKPVKTYNDSDKPVFKFEDPSSTATTLYGFNRAVTAFEKCVTKRDEVNSQLVGLSSDLFNEYSPGDIPTDQVLDPITAATELGNNTGLSLREAQAGMMGIPTSAGFSLRLELSDGEGSTYEVDAEIYTNAQPNDSNGNPTGFKVGNTYDPSNFQEPIYVSYEYIDPETGETSTDFTQLVNPFTVLEATNESGESVEEVTPTSQTAQTADISSIEEELASIREEQQRLLEKSESPGGAGAGYFGGGSLNTGAIAAVLGGIGVAYALFSQGGS